jgi:hypothetical protein
MTAEHNEQVPEPPLEVTGVAQPAAARLDKSRREIWISFEISLAITALLIGLNWVVGQRDVGKLVEAMTYDLLQHHLSSGASPEDLKVIVLDISGIQMRPTLGARPWLVTDRNPLEKVVDSLTAKRDELDGNGKVRIKNRPLAIGLDVDFSPDVNGYAHPDDPRLLGKLLDVNHDIPIRVGVNGSLALGPRKWLVEDKYMDLASCVIVPNPETDQSARYMPEWIVVKDPAATFGSDEGHCPSMGIELAGKTVAPVRWWLRPFARSSRQSEGGRKRLSATEFLVDYSSLQALIASTKEVYDPDAGVAINVGVGGKIVLLGRTKDTGDMFTVPGSPERSYPGVYLHACAAQTLLENYPLYELTWPGRILLDLSISLAIFGSLLASRLRRNRKGREVTLGHRVPGYLSCFMALVVTICAVGLVRWTHLMWDDFILVVVALLVHTPLERNAVELYERLARFLRSWHYAAPPSPESP